MCVEGRKRWRVWRSKKKGYVSSNVRAHKDRLVLLTAEPTNHAKAPEEWSISTIEESTKKRMSTQREGWQR